MKTFCAILFSFSFLFGLEFSSIEADFIQNLVSDEGSDAITYKGKLIATSDSKAYWRYDSPIKKEIFVNNNKVIVYEPDLEQAIISERLNLDFLKIINTTKESKDGLISEINGQIFKIFLKDNKPDKITYTDELDNSVEIKLENVVLNKKIDYEKFKFNIPNNTDIIFDK
ncbi:LolA-like outer membrane lipoprotein chaperone [Helicobacter sp. MIT 14-3879]|uniref:LolA-like outer membrane lipoprotein chaperone n=1 Tax=Helicobacter sp. MIT 14-3879 TaxID=2040649 RepID=UPI000E1E4F44|nr:LolA-like outer membrane lipoprotein chaperone [Helicobacter sp. MIT 14-3879]RDU65494.1 hypothetical protein CQA44_00430 [Helicobacter sp. MIT 14-3879]